MRKGFWKWVVVALVAMGAVLAVALSGSDAPGGRRITGERTAQYLLDESSIAEVVGADEASVRPAAFPADVNAIESQAARVPFVSVPLPADRAVASATLTEHGAQVDQALLYYDEPADAEQLEGLAERLLPYGFGLEAEPFPLEGVDGARSWRSDRYVAVTFRKGNYVGFVGGTGVVADLGRMAAEIHGRLPPSTSPNGPVPTG